MEKAQNNSKQFMELFGQTVPPKPVDDLSESDSILRAQLTLEECFETITKGLGLDIFVCNNEGENYVSVNPDNLKSLKIIFSKERSLDLVEAIDGVGDINYVNYGMANALGVDMEPIDIEIHRSNMTKLWTHEELMQNFDEDIMYYVEYDSDIDGRRYRVHRKSDGKVIKSKSYSPANIKGEIEKQKNGTSNI